MWLNSIINNVKKVYTNRLNIIIFIFKELNLFYYIQLLLLKTSILIYFNSEWQLYININTFKKCDIKGYFYYILNELLNKFPDFKII